MNKKRLSIVGTMLALLLALVIVACGPAVPPGMEEKYDAIVKGEEATSQEGVAETPAVIDPSAEVGPSAPTDLSQFPPISDRLPKELETADYTKSDTGLLYYDLVAGDGTTPKDGSIATINYAIWLMDEATGKPIALDDTFTAGQPFTFILGSQQVFPGWEEGVLSMKQGGSRQLVIPADLAFGEQGVPGAGIPANATIAMEIELLDVQAPPTPEALSDSDYETTDSGLKIAVLTEGTGEEAAELGDTVTVDFTIWVADGERFFTGSGTSGQPFTFPIGSGAVFPGWDEGVTGMVAGESRQLLIPADIALGEQGFGEIVPPNSDLLMQVELLDVVKPQKATVVDESDFVVTDSGLKYYDIVEGTGATPQAGQTVIMNYTGWLEDGTQFESSVGREPLPFALGTGAVIPGWDEGIATMKVGGVRQLVIPADLAYGASGSGPIPPGATLIFEVELLDIQ